MDAETSQLWRDVFDAADRAFELDPDEQRVFVARCIVEHPAVGTELKALIDGADSASVLEMPASAFAALFLEAASNGDHADDGADPMLGLTLFGPYRVRREIGSGGMGAVYLAERSDDQYRKEVALKVLPRWSGDDRRRLQRFLDERQILATLDHPGIARLLDGGVTTDGLPWFAMEYIDGEHIDRYCDARRLSIEDRLKLFCDVCQAVQYAHRNLIVHRDLKPSNILVGRDGRIALVDFGIARLVAEQQGGEDGVKTTGDRLLTPLYSSPEQIRGERVSTSADVYALGVLLHALLTGSNPYRLTTFEGYEVARAVLEQEPERPSISIVREGTRIVRPGASCTSRALVRGGTSARLARRLRGDLDAIVLTAMAKDPARRYPTVQQLEMDVRRHLAGLPVLARPDNRLYLTGKFLRRHRIGAAITTAAALLLVGFATVMTVQRSRIQEQAVRIANERDRAERVSQTLLNIFGSVAPGERGVAPRDILDSAAAQVHARTFGYPEQRARLMFGMAGAYHQLGLDEKARALLDSSLGLRRSLRPIPRRDIAETAQLLGAVLLAQHNVVRADSVFSEALALRRSELGPSHADVSRSLIGLSAVRRAERRFADAEHLAREAMAIDQSRGREGQADLAQSTRALAAAFADAGDRRAVATFRQALVLMRATHVEEHSEVAATIVDLATALRATGEQRSADSLIRYAVELNQRLVTGALLSGTATRGATVPDSADDMNASVKRALSQKPSTATGNGSAVSAKDAKIAFVSDRDGPDVLGNMGNQEIYVMNADGSGQKRLTNDNAMDFAPVFSHDGRKIAFVKEWARVPQIFAMDADGSNVRQLTHPPTRGTTPTWSPDGRRIAFSSRGTLPSIMVVNANGTGLVTLATDSASMVMPAWSPDGRHIAYASKRDGRAEIFVMDADGSHPVRLTFNTAMDTRPAWSPDGKRIAFQSERDGNQEIYVMNADGSNQTRLTNDPAEDGNPSWSPDGRRIVFYRRVLGHGQLFVMNADGSNVRRLTDLSPVSFNSFPSWSPARP